MTRMKISNSLLLEAWLRETIFCSAVIDMCCMFYSKYALKAARILIGLFHHPAPPCHFVSAVFNCIRTETVVPVKSIRTAANMQSQEEVEPQSLQFCRPGAGHVVPTIVFGVD